MNKILHPIKSLEKWALQRLLKRVAEELPEIGDKAVEVWKAHEDEIYKKVATAVKTTLVGVITKALEKQNKQANNAAN